ncbi:GtrA family protein [Amnibacterium kyonggiense]|uniref:GtrA-like protein n=1 Tax=Amnibacterium kyonggiense TaxID=595671 RepID=A0A4V3EA71_9MICO|nr:GtrA family protein [Amnibacterium kyonggiense]TDS74964.1 GtrA-like protein [Amnibacterium kyonggiense]
MPTALRRFATFFLGSLAGLTVDLGGFAALVALGVSPALSNLCSSFASISLVYLLVTRLTFGVGASPKTYVLFVAWYTTSILTFSALIGALTSWTDGPPILCKLATVPVSFAANYLFSRFLFRKR